MTGVVCLSSILQESPEALGKSKSPVLQMCSRIYIFPELKDYVIAESLLSHSSHLCPVGCTQTGMAGIQEALLSCPDLGKRGHSLAIKVFAPVKHTGAICGNYSQI